MIETANGAKPVVHIKIGEYYATGEPQVLYTLLGSCVAVCLFDPAARIGGMNHILLPGTHAPDAPNPSARYSQHAMELLMDCMTRLGARRDRLVAKAFGGAHVIPAISAESGVGQKIATIVIDFLERKRIKLISRDLGGRDTRKIYYHADTGEVYLKRIPARLAKEAIREEQLQAERIKDIFRSKS